MSLAGLGRRVMGVEATVDAARIARCETCRFWGPSVFVADDGTTSRPEQCPGCGRSLPWATEIHLIGIDWDCV